MKIKLRITMLFLFFTCCLFPFLAVPHALAGVPFITTPELKAKMDSGVPLTLADALSSIEFNGQSIVGAVNIPAGKVEGNPHLPENPGQLLVFFCLGPKCGKSRIAAEKAVELGYTNVMVYNEGLPAWIKAGLPVVSPVRYPDVIPQRMKPAELQAQMDSVFILDIRGEEHMKLGKIAGAHEILLEDLSEKYTSLPHDKKIVVIDHAGKQLLVTVKFLASKEYGNVAILDGGVSAWLKAGLPIVK